MCLRLSCAVRWIPAIALFFSPTLLAAVSGRVFETDGVTPIEGALVTLQATDIQTASAADGSYELPIAAGMNHVIVGAKKGYFNVSVEADAGEMQADILLAAVPPANDPAYEFRAPENCAACHPNQYAEWSGTSMSLAGVNMWVHDLYSGTGTAGGMGGFVYLRDSAFAAHNPNSECASCHQPERWVASPFSAMEALQPPPSMATAHGVSCDICHKIADIDVTRVNFPGLFPGVVTVTRPEGPEFHQVQYGVLPDTNYVSVNLMRASYQPQLSAEVCAACHQDSNDPLENHTYSGVISEPTYLEWLASPYGDLESAIFATCTECHMPPADYQVLCAVLFPPLIRPQESVRSHKVEGTTPVFLENAVELTMQAQLVGDEIEVHTNIFNAHTGHHVPTGVTIRNMILLVEAWPDGADPVLDRLAQTAGETVHALGGVGDPNQGYYAGLPGKLFAKVIHDEDMNAPTFFTDAAGIVFDNRIPAFAEDDSTFRFAAPLAGGVVRVRARLVYRRSFRNLVDAKQWTHDGHGNPLADLAPPDFGHLMESSEVTLPIPSIGGACCQADGTCEFTTEGGCLGSWAGPGTDCTDSDSDLRADACDVGAIPTVSGWGLAILGLLLLIGAKVCFGVRSRPLTVAH